MDLKEIAAVAGKPGLYRVVKPTRNGVILEAVDNVKKKHVAGPNARVSILKEISIYTTDADGTVLLEEVFNIINELYPEGVELGSKSDESELNDFIAEIVPNYDEDRVYASDIKKLVSWYNILLEHYPDIVKEKKDDKETEKASAK